MKKIIRLVVCLLIVCFFADNIKGQAYFNGIGVGTSFTIGRAELNRKVTSYLGILEENSMISNSMVVNGVFDFDVLQLHIGLGRQNFSGTSIYKTKQPVLIPEAPLFYAVEKLNIDATYLNIPLSFRFLIDPFPNKKFALFIEPNLSANIPLSQSFTGRFSDNMLFYEGAKIAEQRLQAEEFKTALLLGLDGGISYRANNIEYSVGAGIRLESQGFFGPLGKLGNSFVGRLGVAYYFGNGNIDQ